MALSKVKYLSNLNMDVVSGVRGLKLDAYLIALEGWRRGLTLKWFVDSIDAPVKRIGTRHQMKIFSLANDNKEHYFYRSRGDLVNNETVDICQHKEQTKAFFEKANVLIPKGKEFPSDTNDNVLVEYASKLNYPVVLKPTSGSMGRGVYINLRDAEEFRKALADLRSEYKYSKYIIEQYLPGNEYRIYVVGDKVISAINRVPANVVGDGKNTISTLIKLKNKERKKNPYLASKPIKVDFEVNNMLERVGYTLDSVPKKGETVFLRAKSNLSAGGDPIDVTDKLTPEVKQTAVDALKALPNIPHGGVDVIVDPNNDKKGYVLEINATAEIPFHMYPLVGKARDIPAAIIDYYFPETKNKEKTTLYFDYQSIQEPLVTMSTNEVEVIPIEEGPFFSKRFIVTGKLYKVGYLTLIKREARRLNLYGFIKVINKKKVSIAVTGSSLESFEEFKELLLIGTEKSRVDEVIEKQWKKPLKKGFEIIEKDDNQEEQLEKELEKLQTVNEELSKEIIRLEQRLNYLNNSATTRYGKVIRKLIKKVK